jgi:hypothetical protein
MRLHDPINVFPFGVDHQLVLMHQSMLSQGAGEGWGFEQLCLPDGEDFDVTRSPWVF